VVGVPVCPSLVVVKSVYGPALTTMGSSDPVKMARTQSPGIDVEGTTPLGN